MPVVAFGTAVQRANILPEILEGRVLVALALSEPNAGSDMRSVKTRARRTGRGWVISGRKTWISDADAASYLLTLCRTDEDAARKDAFTSFLIPRHAPGIHMSPIPKVGNNCMPSADIGFDDVHVDDAGRLGETGAVFETISSALKYSRASMSAPAVGCAKAAFDLAVSHAKQRVQFRRPIAKFQVIRHRLADMWIEITKAQLLVQELAGRIDKGDRVEAPLAPRRKSQRPKPCAWSPNTACKILASAGYASESPMQRYWRDARLYTFGEGTNEIQRETIARELNLR